MCLQLCLLYHWLTLHETLTSCCLLHCNWVNWELTGAMTRQNLRAVWGWKDASKCKRRPAVLGRPPWTLSDGKNNLPSRMRNVCVEECCSAFGWQAWTSAEALEEEKAWGEEARTGGDKWMRERGEGRKRRAGERECKRRRRGGRAGLRLRSNISHHTSVKDWWKTNSEANNY